MAGHRQVRLDQHTAGAIARHAKRSAQRRGGDSRGPEDGAGFEHLVAKPDAPFLDARHRRLLAHFHAQTSQRGAGRITQRLGKRREDGGTGFDQQHTRFRGVDGPKLLRQRLTRNFDDRAGHLHARGAAADEHEGEEALAFRRIGCPLGLLVRHQHPRPYPQRVVERLERRRVRRPVVVAEVGAAGAGGDDQVVVRQRVAVVEVHAPGRKVYFLRFGQQHTRVVVVAQYPANGRGDVARRQAGRCHLIQQRLKDVVVVAVDQRHAHRRAPQRLGGE